MLPNARAWTALAVVLLALPGAEAEADPADSTLDNLLMVRSGELVAATLDGSASQVITKLKLPPEDISAIRISVDGSAAVLVTEGAAGWIDLDSPSVPRFLPCSSVAQISADGDQVLCGAPDGQRTVIYRLRPSVTHQFLALDPGGVEFAGSNGERVISKSDHGVLATPLGGAGAAAVVASEAPEEQLIVSPNGERAVGVFREDETPIVYTFRLDGVGARRKLMVGATPIAFSRDSAWVVVQTDSSACVLRVVGGEYKCWKGYSALGLSTHGNLLLLFKAAEEEGLIDIYAAELDGPSAKRPRSILSGVFPGVTFAPISLQSGGGEVQSEVGAARR